MIKYNMNKKEVINELKALREELTEINKMEDRLIKNNYGNFKNKIKEIFKEINTLKFQNKASKDIKSLYIPAIQKISSFDLTERVNASTNEIRYSINDALFELNYFIHQEEDK